MCLYEIELFFWYTCNVKKLIFIAGRLEFAAVINKCWNRKVIKTSQKKFPAVSFKQHQLCSSKMFSLFASKSKPSRTSSSDNERQSRVSSKEHIVLVLDLFDKLSGHSFQESSKLLPTKKRLSVPNLKLYLFELHPSDTGNASGRDQRLSQLQSEGDHREVLAKPSVDEADNWWPCCLLYPERSPDKGPWAFVVMTKKKAVWLEI